MTAYLTKSRFAAGTQCLKRLWLDVHAPLERRDPEPGSLAEIGSEIGTSAHCLFPGGVLVSEPPWEHEAAVARTAALMAYPSTPAIFEAAFEHGGVRVRVDVLERLARGWWGLREVKSSGSVKDHHHVDVAIQLHVAACSGVRISSVQVLHVNKDYVLDGKEVSWTEFFSRAELKEEAVDLLGELPRSICQQLSMLKRKQAPVIEPGAHCQSPYACDHWDHCTAEKPADWIFHLPRLRAEKRDELAAGGVHRISEIPEEFPLSPRQAVIRGVARSGRTFVAPDVSDRLSRFGPPAFYLDFEAFMPAVPLYQGTRPYQVLPFQWSLHRAGARGKATHAEFLADGRSDPRRAFAESLVRALDEDALPIVVYSSYERTQLNELAARFPDLRYAFERIIGRLADLLPIVSGCVYHPDFGFSDSVKSVAPALCPDVTYDDLNDIADGSAASTAFWLVATGRVAPAEAKRLRIALKAYCKRDTWALMRLHQALISLVGSEESERVRSKSRP